MNDEAKQYLSKYSKKERIKNWFYYNKWWLLLFVLILASAGRLIWQNVRAIKPDYQIAYVGEGLLPEDTTRDLETALSSFGEDLNGDGRIVIQVNQYPAVSENASEDELLNQSAWETKLMSDLISGDSTFFLLSSPDKFQSNYHILANLDGSIPSDYDRFGFDKVYRIGDCPVLVSMELGSYNELIAGENVMGDNMDVIKNLYIGRRFFRDEKEALFIEGYNTFWAKITEGAVIAE